MVLTMPQRLMGLRMLIEEHIENLERAFDEGDLEQVHTAGGTLNGLLAAAQVMNLENYEDLFQRTRSILQSAGS